VNTYFLRRKLLRRNYFRTSQYLLVVVSTVKDMANFKTAPLTKLRIISTIMSLNQTLRLHY